MARSWSRARQLICDLSGSMSVSGWSVGSGASTSFTTMPEPQPPLAHCVKLPLSKTRISIDFLFLTSLLLCFCPLWKLPPASPTLPPSPPRPVPPLLFVLLLLHLALFCLTSSVNLPSHPPRVLAEVPILSPCASHSPPLPPLLRHCSSSPPA